MQASGVCIAAEGDRIPKGFLEMLSATAAVRTLSSVNVLAGPKSGKRLLFRPACSYGDPDDVPDNPTQHRQPPVQRPRVCLGPA